MTDQLVASLAPGGPRVLSDDAPFLHADDLGMTRGDGCFDATLVTTSAGRAAALHLDRHLARLMRSAAALGIDAPAPDAWSGLIDDALRVWADRAGDGQAMLKLVLARGREEHPGGPVAYLTLTALPEATVRARRGIDVVTLTSGRASDAFADAPWLLGGVKTISYAVNMAAGRAARARGADDVLFTSTDGFALEGPTSALIVDTGDELVTTPTGPTGILASITAETVFEALREQGRRTAERLVRPEEIVASRGAWLVSSVRGIAPVLHLDGRPIAHDPEADAALARVGGFPPA